MATEMRPVVTAFAEKMEKVLKENDYKGGWQGSDCTVEYLLLRMFEEAGELLKAVRSGRGYAKECVDVANFSMMVWDKMNVVSLSHAPREMPDIVEDQMRGIQGGK